MYTFTKLNIVLKHYSFTLLHAKAMQVQIQSPQKQKSPTSM